MTIQTEFEVEDSDILDMVNALPQMKVLRWLGRSLLLASFVALGAALYRNTLLEWLTTSIVLLAAGVSCLISPRFAARKALQNFTGDERRIVLEFSEDGLRFESAKGTSSIVWQGVHRVVEDDKAFLFFITEQMAHFLPKRLVSESEKEQIRTLVGKKVQPRPRKTRLLYWAAVWLSLVAFFYVVYTIFTTAGD